MSTLTVVVTNATSASGSALARHFFHEGAHVAVVAPDAAAAAATVRSLTAEPGPRPGRVRGYHADPQHRDQIRQLADDLARDLYRVDLLINNAGTPFSAYGETDEGVERTHAVNHHAPFLLTHLLLASGRLSTGSRIVNVMPAHRRPGTVDERAPDVLGQSWRSRFASAAVHATALKLHELATTELSRRLPAGVTAHIAASSTDVARLAMNESAAQPRSANGTLSLGRRLFPRAARQARDDALAEVVYTRTAAALGITTA